jgi:tRNA (cytidine/uridine-2'-O-)-methyltransferase
MRLALFEPDIPQNAGAIMRLCACLGLGLDIIEPCGFLLTDKNLRRAGMDYIGQLDLARHADWESFRAARRGQRLLLLTTKGARSFLDIQYRQDDILLFGRESAGVPEHVHAASDERLLIPLRPGLRSLNVAMTAAMAAGEALRQTQGFPAFP